jgi:hypothetical protein
MEPVTPNSQKHQPQLTGKTGLTIPGCSPCRAHLPWKPLGSSCYSPNVTKLNSPNTISLSFVSRHLINGVQVLKSIRSGNKSIYFEVNGKFAGWCPHTSEPIASPIPTLRRQPNRSFAQTFDIRRAGIGVGRWGHFLRIDVKVTSAASPFGSGNPEFLPTPCLPLQRAPA